MSASKLNLAIDQGATFRKTITWRAGVPSLPVDLTGCAARMQIRASVSSADVLLSLTTENDGISLGGALGTVEIVVADTQSSGATWREGVYDLEIVLANGDVRRLLEGKVKLSPEVTRV